MEMEHDHSAHANTTAAAAPGEISHPAHGTWEGHVLPGSFFLIWSTWWLISIFRLQLKASSKAPYNTRSWFEFPWALKAVPLEPLLKILLPFVGINGELWAGHVSYRRLYAADGRFEMGNMQDWQHSAMYSAFMVSGLVDALGFYLPGLLPTGTEHGFLGAALFVEGLLFAFHLNGTALDWRLHFLLVMVVFTAAATAVAEVGHPSNVLLTVLRAQLVMLQGVWFCQIAQILYRDHAAWDPAYMGSSMFVPVVFCMWLITVLALTVAVFVVVKLWVQGGKPRQQKAVHEEQIALVNGHSFAHHAEHGSGHDA